MLDGQWQPGQKFQFSAEDIAGADRGAAALIDRTTGTNIGDVTENGGLAAVFDGITSQSGADGARKSSATFAYFGKTTAVPTALESVIAFGSNNLGFVNNINPSTTLDLYGKQGSAPANSTDGTIIGTTTFTDTADESAGRSIACSDQATYWDHVWVRLSQAGAANNILVAELQMTGWIV